MPEHSLEADHSKISHVLPKRHSFCCGQEERLLRNLTALLLSVMTEDPHCAKMQPGCCQLMLQHMSNAREDIQKCASAIKLNDQEADRTELLHRPHRQKPQLCHTHRGGRSITLNHQSQCSVADPHCQPHLPLMSGAQFDFSAASDAICML